MSSVDIITVRPEEGAGRLDRWFRRHYPGLSHGHLEKLLRTGQVRVDGKRARAGDPVVPGQAIRVPPLAAPSTPPPARRVRQEDEGLLRHLVLYRDDSAIILNKPAGLAVQGGTKTGRHVDGLLDTLRFDSAERPRLVHRLDKDTSGVLLIARNAAAAAFFTRAFREKTTRKTYWAAVIGLPKLPQGRIDLALAKRASPRGGERVQADEEGKDAVTYYRVIDRAGDRADPSAARLLRRAWYADHRRRQIWRRGRPSRGCRRREGTAPACPESCDPEPGGRHLAGYRAIAAAYAGDVGFARL